MTHKMTTSQNFNASPSSSELDFLAALLESDDECYPWDVTSQDSEEYFIQAEQQFLMQDLLDEELTPRSEAFFHQLDQLWQNHTQTTFITLQETLHSTFSSRIPTNWLNIIAKKASEVFNRKQSLTEQLVQCAQSVLPNWGMEDLLVLARPYSYAMRSEENQNVESMLERFNEKEWTNLSDTEQAKLSLAIARFAFTELDKFQ